MRVYITTMYSLVLSQQHGSGVSATNLSRNRQRRDGLMTTTTQEAPQQLVTVNVTGWAEYQRSQLIKAIEAVQADVANATDLEDIEVTGWTKPAFEEALQYLAGAKAFVQLRVIMAAIQNGGSVSRDEVYELAGYDSTRSLKGFTRPTNRATNALRESGVLPDDADELLAPKYDLTVKSFQRTQGFTIPLEIVKLYSE